MSKKSRKKRSLENPKVPLSSATVVQYLGAGNETGAGVSVTEVNAMNLTAVWAAVNRISNSIAQLPLQVMRDADGAKTPQPAHPISQLVRHRPSPHMSSFTWRQVTHSHTLTWGNGYGYINRNAAGQALSIQLMMADRTKPELKNGVLRYLYRREDGTTLSLASEDVLHIPGLGYDGISGYSNIQIHKESLGLGMAAQNFGATFFGNGASLGGVLTHPQKLGPDGRANLKSTWDGYRGGGYKGTALLEEGLKYERVGIPPDDAQFLETRQFQTAEIARMFDIPPHMIGDLDKATFSNIAEQSIEFLRYTMMPWIIKWEQELDYKLLSDRERDQGYYLKFNVNGLLRGTQKERYESYAIGVNNGFISRNEVRELEDKNPIEGLDEILTPLNMASENQEDDTRNLDIFKPLVHRAAEQILLFDTRLISDAAKKCEEKIDFELRVNKKYADSVLSFVSRTVDPLVASVSAAQGAELGAVSSTLAGWLTTTRNTLIDSVDSIDNVGLLTLEEIEAELTKLLQGDI